MPSIFIRIINDAAERRTILLDVAMEGYDGDDREANYHGGKLNDSLLSGGGEPLGSMGGCGGFFLCRCWRACCCKKPKRLSTCSHSWEILLSMAGESTIEYLCHSVRSMDKEESSNRSGF